MNTCAIKCKYLSASLAIPVWRGTGGDQGKAEKEASTKTTAIWLYVLCDIQKGWSDNIASDFVHYNYSRVVKNVAVFIRYRKPKKITMFTKIQIEIAWVARIRIRDAEVIKMKGKTPGSCWVWCVREPVNFHTKDVGHKNIFFILRFSRRLIGLYKLVRRLTA